LDSQDKSLVCFDCGAAYTFTAEEQEAFRAKGHNHPPKRCPACRAARLAKRPERPPMERERMPSFVPSAIRQMYPVTCSECGKETQVPFEPRAGRPVYCSDCYHKSRTVK
jgi:CxxC-x17-CxxC domain-containing protein